MNIMKNSKLLIAFLSVLLVSLYGCGEDDARLWTATDSNGIEHYNLKLQFDGIGWTKFKEKSGATIVFRGSYSYREQKAD